VVSDAREIGGVEPGRVLALGQSPGREQAGVLSAENPFPVVQREVQAGRTQVTEKLLQLLEAAGARYRVLEHKPVFTSEQAAAERATPAEAGAKALLVKAAADRYHLLVIAGFRRVDNARLRNVLGTRRVRFARADELLSVTGCRPGAVPPFGQLFGVRVLLDRSLQTASEVAFNAGSHTVSVVMDGDDFRAALAGELVDVAVCGAE
jgi:Ala-tRNA(Pro) deacylase